MKVVLSTTECACCLHCCSSGYTNDKWGGSVEKPMHVVEGMAKIMRGPSRKGRTISGNGLCTFRWFGNCIMAACCHWGSDSFIPLQFLFRFPCWTNCLSGNRKRFLWSMLIYTWYANCNISLYALYNWVQEASFLMGLAYMISAIAIYDEYTNDLLYLREGSCLPRYTSAISAVI